MTTTTLASLDQSAILASLPEALFQTGGAIAAALKAAGYDESATRVIDQLVWWGMTVGELAAELAAQQLGLYDTGCPPPGLYGPE